MWRAALLAISVYLVLGTGQAIWAQTGTGIGQLQAVSYSEVPDPLSLTVIVFDDSSFDLRIRDQMIAALERSEHSLEADSLFELELTTESQTGGFVATGPSLGRLSSNTDDTTFEMNIWSSTQDSILGGRHSDRGLYTASSFAIRATLRERSLGPVVWEGRAIVGVERNEAEPYVPSMVESLVRSLGRTERDGIFPVP